MINLWFNSLWPTSGSRRDNRCSETDGGGWYVTSWRLGCFGGWSINIWLILRGFTAAPPYGETGSQGTE